MTDTSIDRFTVRWRLPAPELCKDATAVLDRLCTDVLDEELSGLVTADEQVAIAAVRVPSVRVRLGPDGEAARAWAQEVASAIAGQLAAGGPGVVRYPNRPAALLDMVLRTCAGDTSLVWAWRRLGLWPTAAESSGAAAAGAVSASADAVTAALVANPAALAPVLAAVGRHGSLPELVALLGPGRLEQLAAAAWSAAGGTAEDVCVAKGRAPAAPAGPAADGLLAPSRPQYSAPGAEVPADRHMAALLSESPYAPVVRAAEDDRVRAALTALALVDAVPGRVAGDGAALLRATLHETAGAAEAVWAGGADVPPGPGTGSRRPGRPAGAAAVALQLTGNAGLLFCLHLAAPLGCLTGSSADGESPDAESLFGPDGSGTRWAMHLLGVELLRRSTPRWGRAATQDPDDPALLAFCGLPPAVAPPHPPDGADPVAARRAAARRADSTVRELRDRLAGRPPARLPQATFLSHVLHKRGEITAFPGWLEVRLDLDEVSVDLRAAGLDLDPGWLPALGCIVRFRYV